MMQPVIIRLADEDRKLLQIEAQNLGLPISEVARKAIRNYFKEKPRKSPAKVLLKWATRKEKINKKTTLTSINYKKYLYGKKV